MVLKRLKNIFLKKKLQGWYERYENRISYFALLLGFVLDNLFLEKVDKISDLLVLTTYIVIAGICILLTNINESKSSGLNNTKIHFWLSLCLQFSLGGLFSAYFVFYIRSATLGLSWPFLAVLAIYFIGNEYFKKRYRSISFSLGVYFFALLSYFIIVVPTILKSISQWTFVLSTIVAIIVFSFYVTMVSKYNTEQVKRNRKIRIVYYCFILVAINVFYFSNIIPPLPITLKDAGVYHNLIPKGDGGYYLSKEKQTDLLSRIKTQVFNRSNLEPVYVYTSVYSPIDLNLNVIHNWQKYNETKEVWETVNNVIVSVKGGREGGYRLYSFKLYPEEGLWRVNVETEDKRLVGRIKFIIKNTTIPVQLIELQK